MSVWSTHIASWKREKSCSGKGAFRHQKLHLSWSSAIQSAGCHPESHTSSRHAAQRPPPVALIKPFHTITSNVGVLGLYHIDIEANKPGKMIEHTEGRKNILTPYTDADWAHVNTQAEIGWNLSSFDPVTMACNKVIVCDTRATRAAGTHKGMFQFLKPYLY